MKSKIKKATETYLEDPKRNGSESEEKRLPGTKRSGKSWQARAYLHGKPVHLGTYKTSEEAYQAYLDHYKLHPKSDLLADEHERSLHSTYIGIKHNGARLGISGVRGVLWRDNRWIARIRYRCKEYYLGGYSDVSEAIRARKEAESHLHEGFVEWYERHREKMKAEDHF